ncbi:hypothetical protein L9F63_014371, partial [Diploptera punctata]
IIHIYRIYKHITAAYFSLNRETMDWFRAGKLELGNFEKFSSSRPARSQRNRKFKFAIQQEEATANTTPANSQANMEDEMTMRVCCADAFKLIETAKSEISVAPTLPSIFNGEKCLDNKEVSD